ncbi:MAG: hypothetical protein CMJ83_21625 [Planctomycetes bacterium]|nr:hypothetical protein [Planctomycetota bacterium]
MTARCFTYAVFTLSCLAGLSIGFQAGPPDFMTNAPGDANCSVCHFSFPLNAGVAAGVAAFELTGPRTLLDIGGSTGTFTARFTSTTRPIHGFQMTVRDSDDAAQSPSWAGSFDPGSFGSNVQTAFGNPDYANHTLNGSFQTQWNVGWTPPVSPPAGPLTAYACGNAANGNASSTGDYIFSDTHTIYQARASGAPMWTIGSTEFVFIEAPTVPNHFYAMVLTTDDSSSTALGGPFTVPLNVLSPLALASIDPVYGSIFIGFVGTLDNFGSAFAQVAVPNAAILTGVTFHLAFATFDPATLQPSEVSNKYSLTVQ